jgi:hypothetical protein
MDIQLVKNCIEYIKSNAKSDNTVWKLKDTGIYIKGNKYSVILKLKDEFVFETVFMHQNIYENITEENDPEDRLDLRYNQSLFFDYIVSILIDEYFEQEIKNDI